MFLKKKGCLPKHMYPLIIMFIVIRNNVRFFKTAVPNFFPPWTNKTIFPQTEWGGTETSVSYAFNNKQDHDSQ